MKTKDDILLEQAYSKILFKENEIGKENTTPQPLGKKIRQKPFYYQFSEYDFTIPDDMRTFIFGKIKQKFPEVPDEVIYKQIESIEDYHYHEARDAEKQGDDDYPRTSAKEFVDSATEYFEYSYDPDEPNEPNEPDDRGW